MSRRRKKKNRTVNETQPESPPPDRAPNIDKSSPIAVRVYQETKIPSVLTDAFKSTIEKAADRSRSELTSEGKLKPMAFFVNLDGTMKTVSLFVKDGHQKEALIRRIQEKALAENTATVIVLSEIDNEHGMLLSGVSSGMKGSARVNYSFDNKTKTLTSWKITWLNQSVQNVLLDDIFKEKD
jgi:hypothetical protein